MSALASNVGADCNLLVSPLKVNVGPMDPDVEDELELLELPELDGRNKLQGTATCLPELEDEPDVPEVAEDALAEELELDPELLKDRIAKSTFPEFGFITTS